MKISNHFQAAMQKKLQKRMGLDTLAGGTEGSDQATPEASASFAEDQESDFGVTLATALDALLGMHQSALAGDRVSLDSDYETLITSVEVYRDGVPKA